MKERETFQTFADWNTLPSMDLVRSNRMSVEISHSLDGVGGSVDCHFIRLHHLLDCLADLTHLNIDSSAADAGVG
jgi:hypothetical protein